MLRQYKCIARERMTTTTPIIINASSPKEAAVKMGKQLGYQCNTVDKTYEFDGSVPCCVAVYNVNNTVNYYNIRG